MDRIRFAGRHESAASIETLGTPIGLTGPNAQLRPRTTADQVLEQLSAYPGTLMVGPHEDHRDMPPVGSDVTFPVVVPKRLSERHAHGFTVPLHDHEMRGRFS